MDSFACLLRNVVSGLRHRVLVGERGVPSAVNIDVGYGGARILDVDWISEETLALLEEMNDLARELGDTHINWVGSSAGNVVLAMIFYVETFRRLCCYGEPRHRILPSEETVERLGLDSLLLACGDLRHSTAGTADRPECVCGWVGTMASSFFLRSRLKSIHDGLGLTDKLDFRTLDEAEAGVFLPPFTRLFFIDRRLYTYALVTLSKRYPQFFVHMHVVTHVLFLDATTDGGQPLKSISQLRETGGRVSFYLSVRARDSSKRVYYFGETLDECEDRVPPVDSFSAVLLHLYNSELELRRHLVAFNRMLVIFSASVDFQSSFMPFEFSHTKDQYLLSPQEYAGLFSADPHPYAECDPSFSSGKSLLREDRLISDGILRRYVSVAVMVDAINHMGKVPDFGRLLSEILEVGRSQHNYAFLFSRHAKSQLKRHIRHYIVLPEMQQGWEEREEVSASDDAVDADAVVA